MAATPKHRRSSRRRKTTRAANRHDVLLNKVRILKKNGGSFLVLDKESGKKVPPHTVTKENPVYKGIKVISSKKKK